MAIIIQNYKFVLIDSRGLRPLASAVTKTQPPIPVVLVGETRLNLGLALTKLSKGPIKGVDIERLGGNWRV